MKILIALLAALFASAPALAQSVSSNTAATAVGSSYVLSSAPAYLTGVNVTSGASAGYVLIFDRTTAPADGTVTPARCLPLAANTGIERTFPTPIWFRTGIVIVFSTTGCYSQTASATAFIAGDFK